MDTLTYQEKIALPSFKELLALQNTARFDSIDILTIVGFMTTEAEVVAHLNANNH